jgi:hypothetical protein
MTRGLVGTALLALGLGLLMVNSPSRAADADAQILPDGDYPVLAKYSAKNIQDALKGKPSDDAVQKAKMAAVLLAAAAQDNLAGKDAQQRATVRDGALKILDLIKAEKYADASKMAGDVVGLEADPNAKKEKMKLMDDKAEMADIMSQFNNDKKKGYGIYGRMYQDLVLKYKDSIPTKELDQNLLMYSYQISFAAQLAHTHKPDKKGAEWLKFTDELLDGAQELSKAIKVKNQTASYKAVKAITDNCTNCHKQIRDAK